MRTGFVSRLVKLETKSYDPRWRCVAKDVDNRFWGDCGAGISEKNFANWLEQQNPNVQVIVVELLKLEDTLKIIVDNYASLSLSDTLGAYEEALEREARAKISLHDVKAKKDAEMLAPYEAALAVADRENVMAKVAELRLEREYAVSDGEGESAH